MVYTCCIYNMHIMKVNTFQ